MQNYRDLVTFDGLDNRRDLMVMLGRLDSDQRRTKFLLSLIPHSSNGFAESPVRLDGPCDAVAAYFVLVNICSQLGVSINEAARRLESEVRGKSHV